MRRPDFLCCPVSCRGFTLLEMAFVVLVAGLFAGWALPQMDTAQDQRAWQTTVERQKRIALALSDYASRRYFLPCPADPTASPAGTARGSCTTDALRDGVLPFRTLGLSQMDVTDGYGNPFTYAISSAIRESVVSAANVESKCRQLFPLLPTWIYLENLFNYINANSMKARLCCQRVQDGNAIQVRKSAAGGSVTTTQGAGGASGIFALPILPALLPSSASNLNYFAYAVISHGRKGRGAYAWGRAARLDSSAAGPDEQENADQDAIYVARAPDTTPGSSFDNIVLWRTQEQMMAETGQTTCNKP